MYYNERAFESIIPVQFSTDSLTLQENNWNSDVHVGVQPKTHAEILAKLRKRGLCLGYVVKNRDFVKEPIISPTAQLMYCTALHTITYEV